MKFLNSLMLKSKIMLSFAVVTVLTILAMGIISYNLSADATRLIVTSYVTDALQQVSNNLNTYSDEVDSIVDSVLIDKSFCTSFRKYRESMYDQVLFKSEVESKLQAMSNVKRNIGNMYIVTKDKQIFTNNQRTTSYEYILQQNWLESIQNGTSKLVVPPCDVGVLSGTSPRIIKKQFFSIIRPAQEIGTKNFFGIIGVDISTNMIKELSAPLTSSKYSGELVIIDESQRVVYPDNLSDQYVNNNFSINDIITSKEQGTYIDEINGVSTLVVFKSCKKFKWKLIEFIPMSIILEPARNIRNGILTIGCISLLILIVVSYLLSGSITKPIRSLQQTMKDVEMGNLDIELHFDQRDEVGQLADYFTMMLARLKDSLSEIYEKEKEKRNLELSLLQHQIYPHFLYNTLDSINWLARMQNAKTISSMITALNFMLKSSIYNGDEMNTIQEELTCVESFVFLHKFSHQQEFKITYQIDESLLNCLIPKLTLQPLVENALLHAFKNILDNAEIGIQVYRDAELLIIDVIDNGIGISEHDINRLTDGQEIRRNPFSGIGIKNINERLKLYFNGCSGLEYSSIPNKQTIARVKIPVWRDNSDKSINCGR